MNIRLIDIDSKIPNLALMKISSFFKNGGHNVGFDVKEPELVIGSLIYKKNIVKIDEILIAFPNAKFDFGGTGYDIHKRLPDEIEFIKPDYNLYPSTYSQGFTTRGCIRKCEFCIVHEKEGQHQKWQHPKEFHDDRFDTIWIMDNNWIANKEWFMETTDWIIDSKLKVIECGFDIRLTDEEIMERISCMRFPKGIHFAYDNIVLSDVVKEKVGLMKKYGINVHKNVIFYVYCDSPADVSNAVSRCRLLKKLNTNAFVMYNIDKNRTPRVKRLQHWANRRHFFWSCDFDDFSWSKSG